MVDSKLEYKIVEMNRGSEKGKFYCCRTDTGYYLHPDGSWKVSTYDGAISSGYFAKREDIEALLEKNPA